MGKLTCEYCKAEPAVLLLVIDLEVVNRPRRMKTLIGEACWISNRRDAERIARRGSSLWLFALTDSIDIS